MDTMPTPVRTAVDAINNGDTEGFVSLFGERGSVDDWGRIFTGPEALRGWSDAELIGKRCSLDVTDVRSVAASTVLSVRVGGDGFNGPSDFAFDVDGDAIRQMRITG